MGNLGMITGRILAFLWFMLFAYACIGKNKKKRIISLAVCVLMIAAVIVLILSVGTK